jgi:hypothetical protein
MFYRNFLYCGSIFSFRQGHRTALILTVYFVSHKIASDCHRDSINTMLLLIQKGKEAVEPQPKRSSQEYSIQFVAICCPDGDDAGVAPFHNPGFKHR